MSHGITLKGQKRKSGDHVIYMNIQIHFHWFTAWDTIPNKQTNKSVRKREQGLEINILTTIFKYLRFSSTWLSRMSSATSSMPLHASKSWDAIAPTLCTNTTNKRTNERHH